MKELKNRSVKKDEKNMKLNEMDFINTGQGDDDYQEYKADDRFCSAGLKEGMKSFLTIIFESAKMIEKIAKSIKSAKRNAVAKSKN